jgi:hypothetical protein
MVKRFKKAGFNTKLIIDVMIASVIVQKAPALVDSLFPVDDSIKSVVGAGAGYLAGSLFKRPDMANASIALGVVELVSPMLDGVLGVGTTSMPLPGGTIPALPGGAGASDPDVRSEALQNYITLNDYTNNPGARLNYSFYNTKYGY